MHEGVDGLLRDKSRPPGKAPIPPDRVAEIVRLTQQPPPHEATHWTRDGEDGWRCRVDGPGDLEGARPQPASLDELQAVHRSGLRRQTHRHRRALRCAAGPCGGAVGRRKISYGRNAHCCAPPAQIRTWSLNHPAPTSGA